MSRNKIQRIIPVRTSCVNRAAAPVPGFPGFTTGYYADGTCIKCTDSAARHEQKKDAESALRVNGLTLRATGRQIVFVYLFFRVKHPASVGNLWGVRYRTGGNLCKKRHSMQICKYGDSEAIRDANFPRVELCAERTCYTKL